MAGRCGVEARMYRFGTWVARDSSLRCKVISFHSLLYCLVATSELTATF